MKTEKDFLRIRILSLFLDRSTLRKQLLILITQVDDSGHRVLQERCGKSPYPAGKHRKSLEHGSSIPAGKFSVFLPVDSCQLPVLSGRNWAENIGKNPKIFRPEYCQLSVLSGRNWVENIGKNPKILRPEYCFQNITGITRNRPFSGQTLRPGYIFLLYFQIRTQN